MATVAPITGASTRAPLLYVPLSGNELHPHLKAPPPRVSSRRDLLCFAGAATALGAAVATGAVALALEAIVVPYAAPTPFRIAEARHRAAVSRFDALPEHLEHTDPARFEAEEGLLHEAVGNALETPAGDLEEFALSFLIALDDGHSMPRDVVIDRLVADAKRLTGAA